MARMEKTIPLHDGRSLTIIMAEDENTRRYNLHNKALFKFVNGNQEQYGIMLDEFDLAAIKLAAEECLKFPYG